MRKESKIGISWRCYLIVIFCILLLLFFLIVFHAPLLQSLSLFLSITEPVQADVLIIESWLSEPDLIEAAEIFKTGEYSYCIVSAINSDHSKANPAVILEKAGIDRNKIVKAGTFTSATHKTYNSAIETSKWIKKNDPKVQAFNVFTAGVHGRKTWTIYKRVFGDNYHLGIITSPMYRYDPDSWWTSRIGFSLTVRNFLGYIYGLLWPFSL